MKSSQGLLSVHAPLPEGYDPNSLESIKSYMAELMAFLKRYLFIHTSHPDRFFEIAVQNRISRLPDALESELLNKPEIIEQAVQEISELCDAFKGEFTARGTRLQHYTTAATTSSSEAALEPLTYEELPRLIHKGPVQDGKLKDFFAATERLKMRRRNVDYPHPIGTLYATGEASAGTAAGAVDPLGLAPKERESVRAALLGKGMCTKKKHEVSIMDDAIRELVRATAAATGHGQLTVMNVGEGKGYVSRVLSICEGLPVVGVDCNPLHKEVALERLEPLLDIANATDRQSKKMLNLNYINRGRTTCVTCRVGPDTDWVGVLKDCVPICDESGTVVCTEQPDEDEGTAASSPAAGIQAKVVCTACGKILRSQNGAGLVKHARQHADRVAHKDAQQQRSSEAGSSGSSKLITYFSFAIMDEEYEYGYDYDQSGSDVYGDDMVREQSTFAAPVVKSEYVSRPEHQTVQRVLEIARDLGRQIGYEHADAECLVLLAASHFDVYRATQLIFDETSLIVRNLANGENNSKHYLVGWDDTKKGLLLANTTVTVCATCYIDLNPGEGRTFCTHFLCKECFTTKLNVHRTEWNQGKLVLRCEDVKKPTCFGMTCIANIEIDITSFLGPAFSEGFLPKHRYQWCHTLPAVSLYPGVTELSVVNPEGATIKNTFEHSRFVPCGTDECAGIFEVERELYEKKTAESIVGKCTECTKRTCFLCHCKEHSPASCAAMRQWQAKESDEGLNVQWMLVHTKACPKCHSQIEKNEGCNHMTCKKCSHEFCWICMGLWSKHGSNYYECNRLSKDDKKDKSIADARTSLARYTHFYDRHRNHMNSVKLDEKTMSAVARYVQTNFEGGNITYLEDIAKTLFDCRYTLANTYIYGYFETGNVDIFEFNQGRLERATEDLSEIVEKCKRGAEMGKSQQEIQNKAAIAKQYLEILRKGI